MSLAVGRPPRRPTGGYFDRVTDSAKLNAQYAEALEEDAALGDDPCNDLVEAAGHWHLADEHDRERAAVERAWELDTGAGPLSGLGAYISYLLTHGHADEARPLLADLRRNPSSLETTYQEVCAAYEAIGDVSEGMRWLNAGANHIVPSLEVMLEQGDPGYDLLLERRERRFELGLPTDVMDEYAERLRAHHAEINEQIHDLTDERGNLSLDRYPLPLWSAEEFAAAQREHPDWYPEMTHEDYRRAVQHELGEVTGGVLVPITLAGLREFARAEKLDPADPETRDDHVFEEARAGRYLTWPPGRNDACWCGSGRKYKKCCGAPGFA